MLLQKDLCLLRHRSGGKCDLLDRSQRSQRGSLCVCQALHPADIEALVRPVTPQRPQMFAALEIPDVDGPVVPATGEPAPIGTHLQRLHRSLMRPAHLYTLPMLHIPPAQHAITVTTDQHRSGLTPCERVHDLAQFTQGEQALSIMGIPDEELSTAPAPAT